MTKKILLFLGIVLLVSGMLYKYIIGAGITSTILISAGGLCKLTYILQLIIKGKYKPGWELLLMALGLILLFTGIKLKSSESVNLAYVLIGLAIIFKISFIISFIIKLRSSRK